MASDDRVEVRLHSRRADRGRAAWNGFVHAVCFVLGVWAFMVAVVSAIDLGNENHRKSSLSGGLLVVGAVVAYVAFKQVLKPTCEFRGGGRGSREGSDGPFNPFTCHLEITESEIEAMAAGTGQPVEVLASRLTSLSPALARKLVEGSQPLGLDLNGLRSLSKETAEVLAQYDGPLSLKGLRTISEEVAEALSHHHGWLSLDGLTELSPACADRLARHRHICHLGEFYNALSLNGLTSLSEDTAAALARFLGNLRLNGVQSLTPAVAERLATHATDSQWGVGELYSLMLDGVTTLSEETAVALANYTGGLSLDGLERPSPEVLRALASHRGNALSLARLVTMPDEVAALFGSRTTRLFLPSLRDVTPAALDALRRNPNVILPDNEDDRNGRS